jgi:hypothetical protein
VFARWTLNAFPDAALPALVRFLERAAAHPALAAAARREGISIAPLAQAA